MDPLPAASTEGQIDNEYGTCVISYNLDVESVMKSVQDHRAGATVTFIGTTRNSFNGQFHERAMFGGVIFTNGRCSEESYSRAAVGKVVRKLEYQAYTKLALKTMANIVCNAAQSVARSEHATASDPVPPIIRCALHHRIGIVPCQVIAVSSPHRKEAFIVCELILEEVKRKAQIWKREYYEGEDETTAEWKINH